MIERPLSAELEDFRFMSDWNPYFFVGTIALYSIWSIRHRLHLTIQAAVVRHAPELQRKSMYRTKHGWMPIHFIWHSVIGPTTWSVSCCRPAVLMLAQWSYCSIANTFVLCMVTCVFFALSGYFSFDPSISCTLIVRADSSSESYELCGHKTTTPRYYIVMQAE